MPSMQIDDFLPKGKQKKIELVAARPVASSSLGPSSPPLSASDSAMAFKGGLLAPEAPGPPASLPEAAPTLPAGGVQIGMLWIGRMLTQTPIEFTGKFLQFSKESLEFYMKNDI